MNAIVPAGTPIAVVAPCGVYDPAKLDEGLRIARAFGHDVRPFPGMLKPHRYLAADDDARLAHLVEALTSPDYGAVWIARGGYGLTRLLPRLPVDDLVARPVIGFSDVTALFAALHPKVYPLIHAPMPHSLPATDEASRTHLFDLLAGAPLPALHGESWIGGEARGWLCGGNLAVLAALCGTPWQLDADGAILVLEDIGEAPYRIDRLLQQLVSAGVLEGVAGIALGEFTKCDPPDGSGWTLRDVLLDHLRPLGVPVVGNLPVGHGAANRAFPWGARARLADGRLAWEPVAR